MKFSENWLRQFVDPPLTSEELAHALTMAGLEVEALENAAPPPPWCSTARRTQNKNDTKEIGGCP